MINIISNNYDTRADTDSYNVVGVLWCLACSCAVNYEKRQKVLQHLDSDKHKTKLVNRLAAGQHQRTLAESISAEQRDPNTILPNTIPPSHLAYIVHCLRRCLVSGIDISKIAEISDLLSDSHPCVPSARSNLQLYIPYILKTEQDKIKAILKSLEQFGIIFDGTPYVGELVGIIIRYVADDWSIRQLLIDVRHTDRSLNSDKLGGLINDMISDAESGYGVSMKRVFASMRDSASLNGSSLEKLSSIMPNNVDAKCVSHALNRVGQQWVLPNLAAFMTPWNQLFAHSGNVLLIAFPYTPMLNALIYCL